MMSGGVGGISGAVLIEMTKIMLAVVFVVVVERVGVR